jgi:type 2 lantibiotic biosynthesis protein LanM
MGISMYSRFVYLSSLTLRERLLLTHKIKSVYKEFQIVGKLNLWKLRTGEASEDYFFTRLKWSGISKDSLPKILSPIKDFDFDGFDLPSWVGCLSDFVSGDTELKAKNVPGIPFSDVLYCLVEYFFKKVTNIPKDIAKTALEDLKITLLNNFSEISSQVLLENMRSLNLGYRDYVDNLLKDRFKSFFEEYTYLARLIFNKGDFWLKNCLFLFDVYEKDKLEIFGNLGIKNEDIIHIHGDLSESHNEGKNVAVISTKSKKFVFKNRNTLSEKKLFDFIGWLNHKVTIKQYIPWIIGRKFYGWMEYIDQKECVSVEEVKNYYVRCGFLLCLFYLFGITDLHSENLIAHAGFPLFIDLETMLSPLSKLNRQHLNALNKFVDKVYGLSVSRVGMLPQWLLGPDTSVYNNSSLGGSRQGVKYPHIFWKHINRDNMTFDFVEIEPPTDKNLVYLKGKLQNPKEYSEEIIQGFTILYKFLQNSDINKVIPKLESFRNIQTRYVFRATKVYTLLLSYLNHPEFLRSGIDRSIEMEILAKGLLGDLSKKHIFWDVLDSELEQLERNDVPYFYTKTSGSGVYSYKTKVCDDVLRNSGFDGLITKFKSLSTDDINFQKKIISGSLEADVLPKYENKFIKYSSEDNNKVDKSCLLNVVDDVFNRIYDTRIERYNRITWVSYVSNIVSHTYGYKPVGLDLANGNIGVALFLSALSKVTNDDKHLNLIRKITNPVVDILNKKWSKREYMFRFGTGGTTGVASLLYVFTKMYEYLKEHYYLDVAKRVFDMVEKQHIDRSIRQDIVSGNAGLLLALVKYYEVSKDVFALNLAQYCSEKIIDSGYHHRHFIGWEYQQNKRLLGFSHGSSGILYALSRFYRLTKNKNRLEKVFKDCLTYEEVYYNRAKKNWPDYRYEKESFGMVSWCHGALGIGMSRLHLYNLDLYGNNVKKDLLRAISKTLDTGGHFLDTLCCGNGGRIDFILELRNTEYYNNELENYLHWLIYNLYNKYIFEGDFSYYSKFETDEINIGFYQGVSGICYELLRYLYSSDLDSVLLFK